MKAITTSGLEPLTSTLPVAFGYLRTGAKLCPFQYFGVTDTVDLESVRWSRGGYNIRELANVYTGNDLRAKHVITSLNRYGIPSASLSTTSKDQERNNIKKLLVSGEIRFIFVVDLYNEGVDIPELNTVLFLRPTESLTVFLQQLGRGLRLHESKDCLTVLDFVGRANKNITLRISLRRYWLILIEEYKRICRLGSICSAYRIKTHEYRLETI